MIESLPTNHLQITRQIRALEKSVLAFQPTMVGAVGRRGAMDTNLAIILSARLANVWKRIGRILPSRSEAAAQLVTACGQPTNGTRGRTRGKAWAMMV